MLCEEAEELMSAELDRELRDRWPGETGSGSGMTGATVAALEQHLDRCRSCGQRRRDLRALDGRLRGLRAASPATPIALRQRIAADCARACADAHLAPGRIRMAAPAAVGRRRRRSGWSVAVGGAAAALFALFALFALGRGNLSRMAVRSPDGPCQLATVGESPVALACVSGGRAGAAREMERLTELGRSRGLDLQCATCHLDQHGFGLTAGAREKFASLLAATRG